MLQGAQGHAPQSPGQAGCVLSTCNVLLVCLTSTPGS